jgi:ABC-2 type transport system permease protein
MFVQLTLWRKELAAYFLSPIAYVAAIFFLLITGFNFYFVVGLFSRRHFTIPDVMEQILSSPLFFWPTFLLIVPVLTMRTFAEEKSAGTIETLMTAPVTERAVVLAKFLAALTIFVFIWLPTAAYPFLLEIFSTEVAPLDIWPVASGYAGVLLLGMFYLSVGVLCSALTGSQVVAAIVTYAVTGILFFVGLVHTHVAADLIREISLYVSSFEHQQRFVRGIVDSRPIVFYASGTVLMLFATIRLLEGRRG